MKRIILLAFLWLHVHALIAQNVGIGTTTPHANAILEINSSNKGLLLPRLTDTNAVTGVKPAGLTIYSNSDGRIYFFDGSKWQSSAAHSGSDSLWYLMNDSIVYSNKGRIGFGLSTGQMPNANFHGTGSFLMQEPVLLSNSTPAAGQTHTMNNLESVVLLSSTDSVFRILDPGGASNPYTNLNQGSVRIFNILEPYLAYQISFGSTGFGLGSGDTLWISTAPLNDFRGNYEYRFTNTNTIPSTINIAQNYQDALYIYFRANGDGINGDGFDITVRKVYASGTSTKRLTPFGKAISFSPEDLSFRVGLISGDPIGIGSFGAGQQVSARGNYAIAMGRNIKSDSLESIALGADQTARGNNAVVIGSSSTVGLESIGIGRSITANSTKQLGLGNSINVTGVQALAVGNNLTAAGDFSFTAGHNATSNGLYSLAIGADANALSRSVAIGHSAISSGVESVVIGENSAGNLKAVGIGSGAHATGINSVAIGNNSVATGAGSTALGADAFSSGSNAIAIGSIVNASGNGAIAIGSSVTASGNNSTALGYLTSATFNSATAMGSFTVANGSASTAMGFHTRSNGSYSLVAGVYNDPIVPIGSSYGINTPLFILGNGIHENLRRNALVVRASGNTEISGFTRLGNTYEMAPLLKMKEITDQTSAATNGGVVTFAHGLTRSKILSMSILLNYGAGDVLPSYTASAGFEFNVAYDDVNIYVYNISGNSGNILSKPLKVLITYKE